ncbi:MAG TPA: hypothetical protein VKZ75_07455, partial [Cyclobacteriaceae bacterium]|nr:hypothetical protein [Cyclobacteriaceae bacterium]
MAPKGLHAGLAAVIATDIRTCSNLSFHFNIIWSSPTSRLSGFAATIHKASPQSYTGLFPVCQCRVPDKLVILVVGLTLDHSVFRR